MKIAVLTSGGVDSSVALRLLKDQGHDVTAFYLKIWLEDELTHLTECPWESDLSYVREVCSQADVPLNIVSMQQTYFDRVVNFCISEVRKGLTPNPDVFCNSRIKFGLFLDTLSGFDAVASGHYAMSRKIDGKTHLIAGPDAVKDQTYFLANLPSNRLDSILFPVGHLTKPDVRRLAQHYSLPNSTRKDSQGICFLGKFKYRDFLKHYLGETTGCLIDRETGDVVGSHSGFWYYTIGQRQGIGLSGGPWYVVDKNPEKNTVIISKRWDGDSKNRFMLRDCNWFSGSTPTNENLSVKLRHGPHRHRCELRELEVTLHSKDQGVAPGQFAVFYSDNICLGSGVIC